MYFLKILTIILILMNFRGCFAHFVAWDILLEEFVYI